MLLGLGCLAALVGVAVDPRDITGQPAWAKPARFSFSFGLYALTLLWLLTFVRGHARLVRLISWATAAGVVLEVAWVFRAAAAGTTSHFNLTTPTASTLTFAALAVISLVTAMALLTAALLLRQHVEPPALAWALRLGLLLSLVGMAVAALMVTPTPAQKAAADLGAGMPVVGAHTVGPPDGGPGMAVTNFSTAGGDVRVAHFVGVHALQALALLGLLLTRGPRRLDQRHRTALVWIAAAAWLGLTLVLTWQARRAQPFTDPDAATVVALAVLAAATAIAVGAVFRHARTTR
ncbi:hypothetical protein [Kitasatospora sp. NPDC057500]|uniref:hypothetical protein n=1 Tax=Kitasatospora sp. NPDC057500 TaxID=3346151 RepID=UPI0036A2579A